MTEHIPEVWKAAVLGILAQGLCSDRLRVTARARRDFEDMFTDQMVYEMVDLFADYFATLLCMDVVLSVWNPQGRPMNSFLNTVASRSMERLACMIMGSW